MPITLKAKPTLDFLVANYYTVHDASNSPGVVIQYAYKEVEGGNTLVDSVKWGNQLEGQGLRILDDIHRNYNGSMFDEITRKKLPGWIGGILNLMKARSLKKIILITKFY